MLSKPRRKLWSDESMVGAVKSVEGGKSLREASRLYNVPLESLRRRVNGSVELICRPGPPTVLTAEEEECLAKYLIEMAEMGFGLTREDVMRLAFVIVDKSGQSHPFRDGTAGRGWFEGFRARHPQLTLRTPQPLSYSRALCSNQETIQDFFAKLGAIFARLNLLSKPMQIFNADETGVTVVHKPGKVVAELGRRIVWSLTSAEKGKTHTIMSCVSASGFVLPPMIIYPRKRAVPDHLKEGAVPGTLFKNSENGWINQEIYMEWFQFFLKSIPPARPVLLLEDGHASHISMAVIELARANDVHLLCLPAHNTHILQPLDVGVFKSFKTWFSKACHKYIVKNPGRVITTDIIASLVAEAWPQSLTPLNIMSGFKKCGVYPINPGEVSDRQLAHLKTVEPKTSSLPHSSSDCMLSSKSPNAEIDETSPPPVITPEHEALYQTRYEEGYNLFDAGYIAWLKINHPEAAHRFSAVDSTLLSTLSDSYSAKSSASIVTHHPKSSTSNPTDTTSHSVASSTALSVCSKSSSDILKEVLVLPELKPKPSKRKRQPAINSKARLITDTEVLEELKRKEIEKTEKEAMKNARKSEREQKKKEKEQRKKEKELLKKQKAEAKKVACGGKKTAKKQSERREKTLEKGLKSLFISKEKNGNSEDESEAQCPKCGRLYGEDESLWICCDGCNTWFDINCTTVSTEDDIPEQYFCEQCK